MTDFYQLIPVLVKGGVDFIIIGGVAAALHGAARLTRDFEAIAELEAILEERKKRD